MVGAMAKIYKRTDIDDLVLRARMEADALGQLYDFYYEQVFRFCLCRLFRREAAEDVTSTVFLNVACRIRHFTGRTEQDFRNWLYRIAANHANSYIRKKSRRKQLLAQAVLSMRFSDGDCTDEPTWPMLYQAILKLKPKHQTIITLRFFENLEFEQIGKIINARPATVRVTLHRILKELRSHLQTIADGGARNV